MLAKVSVSDADAKKYYNENKSQFKYPDRVRASHILISADPENIKQMITSDKANKDLSKEWAAKRTGHGYINKYIEGNIMINSVDFV